MTVVNALAAGAGGGTLVAFGTSTDVSLDAQGIDATGNTEVSAAIQAVIDAASNGSRIIFHRGGIYWCDASLAVTAKHYLYFDLQGATIVARTPAPDGGSIAKATSKDADRANWSITNGDHLVWRNGTVIGANAGAGTAESAYVPALEHQHCFSILGASNVEIDNVDMQQPYGDFVYLGVATPSAGHVPTVNAYIHDCTMSRTGRQGISCVGCTDVLITGNTIKRVRWAVVDIEPNYATDPVRRVTFASNQVGTARQTFINASGVGGNIGDVVVDGNTLVGLPMNCGITGPSRPRRGPFTFTNNTSDTQYGAPAPGNQMITFNAIDGVTVTGNVAPLQNRAPTMIGAYCTLCCGVTIHGNAFTGGTEFQIVPYQCVSAVGLGGGTGRATGRADSNLGLGTGFGGGTGTATGTRGEFGTGLGLGGGDDSEASGNVTTPNAVIGAGIGDGGGSGDAIGIGNTPNMAAAAGDGGGTGHATGMGSQPNVVTGVGSGDGGGTGSALVDTVYVRDWTDPAGSGNADLGAQPDVAPAGVDVWRDSDVWNQTDDVPRLINDDLLEIGDPFVNGGDNWAWVRVSRQTQTLPDLGVYVLFLTSLGGIGNNFELPRGPAQTNPVPTVFGGLDPTTLQSYRWNLGTTMETHVCIAVDVTAYPQDPTSSLLSGHSPGPSGTDVDILGYRNLAQRNVDWQMIWPDPRRWFDTYFVPIHNAATVTRPMRIRYTISGIRDLITGAVRVVGDEARDLAHEDDLVLETMRPGEIRWIGVRIAPEGSAPGHTVNVNFAELDDRDRRVTGFTIALRTAPIETVIADLTTRQRILLRQISRQRDEVEGRVIEPSEYLASVGEQSARIVEQLDNLVATAGISDDFEPGATLPVLREALDARDLAAVALAHGSLLNRADALVTAMRLDRGNTADIVQTVRWQEALVADEHIRDAESAVRVRERSAQFLGSLRAAPELEAAYVTFVRRLEPELRELARLPIFEAARSLLAAIDALTVTDDPADAQGAHRAVLLIVEESLGRF